MSVKAATVPDPFPFPVAQPPPFPAKPAVAEPAGTPSNGGVLLTTPQLPPLGRRAACTPQRVRHWRTEPGPKRLLHSAPMTAWKVDDEVYTRFVRERTYYEARRIGVVTGIGGLGITIKLDKPRHDGALFARIPFHVLHHWRTLGEGEAYCREHPTIDVGRVER